ncbi:hypothetical protein [Halobacillus mangrovi]|uniref:hypothetical protein n=1 Tax=Halobacillus mangrovi TaxID=402384 RepID=UPI0018DBAFDF|nr:hypothetical protein [Halobacillus mangrovi]
MEIGAVIIVIILSLWSITKTIEKVSNKIIEKQEQQNELLKEIKSNLDIKK